MAPRRPKDKSAPKRPPGAYGYFMMEQRKNIVRKLGPNHKFTDVAVEMGRQWRALSAGQKAKFANKAKAAMAVYSKKSKAYKGTEGHRRHSANMLVYQARKRRFSRIAAGLPVRSKKKKKKKVAKKKKKSKKKKKKKVTKKKKKSKKKKKKKSTKKKKKATKKKKKVSKKKKKSSKRKR